MCRRIVENGTGLLDSNSYVTLEYSDNYFSARSNSTWAGLTEEEKEVCLIKATDYVDSAYKWKGIKGSAEQSLNFPRKNLVDDNGYKIECIPAQLKNAICECAVIIADGEEMFTVQEQNGVVTSEHIGSLSFTYDVSQKIKDSSLYDSINLRLRGLYEDTSKSKIVIGNVKRAI